MNFNREYALFLLKRPLNALTLYSFSRRLADCGLQFFLKKLPLSFLTGLPKKKNDLPQEPEKRLTLFLARHGMPEQSLAAYLSLYPEITGDDIGNVLINGMRGLDSFPNETTPDNQVQSVRLIRLFYALCLHNDFPVRHAEHFEARLNEAMDFRLEAAALERLKDSFYEDDFIDFVLPDWNKTNKDKLVLNDISDLIPLNETPNRQKTAEGLAHAVIAMILRDGFIIPPSSVACRCDKSGKPYFTRALHSVSLNKQEHTALRALIDAFRCKNYAAAVRALRITGYIPCSEMETLLENVDKQSEILPLSQRVDALLNCLLQNGLNLPFFIRYIARVLTETEKLCLSLLQTTTPWDAAKEAFSLFLSTERKEAFKTSPSSQDFKKAFLFEKHQIEHIKLQNKKLPAFQQDSSLIQDIIRRQSIGACFKPKQRHLWPIILPTVTLLIIIWLSLKIGL